MLFQIFMNKHATPHPLPPFWLSQSGLPLSKPLFYWYIFNIPMFPSIVIPSHLIFTSLFEFFCHDYIRFLDVYQDEWYLHWIASKYFPWQFDFIKFGVGRGWGKVRLHNIFANPQKLHERTTFSYNHAKPLSWAFRAIIRKGKKLVKIKATCFSFQNTDLVLLFSPF